ncbi:fucose-binding lectin II [Streptomyces anulatus]|uniref:fucose-binding lectin II n=1 Tax=Streptomyces anulatus TaxID=1892 RepID=UPI00324C743E
MSDKASASAKDNKAEVWLPAGVTVHVKVKTNSKATQKVALTSKDGTVDHEFSGAGEKNMVIGETTITPGADSPFNAVFEYSGDDNVLKPSKLNCGGPYDIGNFHMVLVVAENGDDEDFNDTVLEFSWFAK